MTTPTPRAMERANTALGPLLTELSPRVALAIDAAVEEAVREEREACEQVCDERVTMWCHENVEVAKTDYRKRRTYDYSTEARECWKAIRARGAS